MHEPEHKGKVENGGVHYVQCNFLGGREPTTVSRANRDVRRWCLTTAGKRIHGTTRERLLERFTTERDALQPLPGTPYDLVMLNHRPEDRLRNAAVRHGWGWTDAYLCAPSRPG